VLAGDFWLYFFEYIEKGHPMRLPMLAVALCLLHVPTLAEATDPDGADPQPLPAGCAAFTWDVQREFEAMQAPASVLQAAATADAVSKPIPLGVRHDLKLHPQREVTLAARPGKSMPNNDATAGMVAFRIPTDGRYRIALTTGHWLDVIDAGKVIPSLDFQGKPGCPLAHKFVEFQLPAGRELLLQLSGGTTTTAGVLITAVRAR
jgi:hypothetical protein